MMSLRRVTTRLGMMTTWNAPSACPHARAAPRHRAVGLKCLQDFRKHDGNVIRFAALQSDRGEEDDV